jgi:hypothetical protein
MTQKEQFVGYMKSQGFTISQTSPANGTHRQVPRHRISEDGTHTIISSVEFVNFDGVDTMPGDLGCLTFFYYGIERRKYHKDSHREEILKLAFCPKTAEEAIEKFNQWKQTTHNKISSWKVIL